MQFAKRASGSEGGHVLLTALSERAFPGHGTGRLRDHRRHSRPAGLLVAPRSGGLFAQGMEAQQGRDTDRRAGSMRSTTARPRAAGRALDGTVRLIGASGSLSDHSPPQQAWTVRCRTPAVQRKEPVTSAGFVAAQFEEAQSRSVAVRVGQQPTRSRRFV